VAGEFADRSRWVSAPDEELIVIASRSQEIGVVWPFKTTDLLGMTLVFGNNTVSFS
jgi:hypothetical protein